MKIAEEQKKQFIVLCCLIVFVLAFAVVKIVGSGSQAQPRQTQAAAKKTDAVAEPSGVAESPPQEQLALAESGVEADAASRDPFIPQVNMDAPVVVPVKIPKGTRPPIIKGLDDLEPFTFTREIKVTTNNPPAKEPESDPSQSLRLTGIIQGAINVAILRGTDGARFIVREGQVIDGKYRVDLVTRFGVRLSHNGKSYLLSLGGSDVSKGAQ